MNISKSVQPDTTHHEPAATRRVRETILKISHLGLLATTLLVVLALVLAIRQMLITNEVLIINDQRLIELTVTGEVFTAGVGMYDSDDHERAMLTDPAYQPTILTQGDLTGDGQDEIVIGHAGSPAHWFRGQIYVFSFDEGEPIDLTDRFIGAPNQFAAISARATIGDFDGNGLSDLAIFEAEGRGGLELEDHVGAQGAFVGAYPPMLFLQSQEGLWQYDNGFADAVLARRQLWGHERCGTPYEPISRWDPLAGDPPGVGTWVEAAGCDLYEEGDGLVATMTGQELHAKYVSSGDITGTGIDVVTAETGGGWATVESGRTKFFVFMRDADSFYAPDDGVISPEITDGPDGGGWRHHAHELVDISGDGVADLVLGRLANVDAPGFAGHSNLRNKAALNNGEGEFDRMIELPDPLGFFPDDQRQYAYATRVDGIVVANLNNSGLADIVLLHTRGGSNVTPSPIDDQSGRWLQVLLQNSDGSFEDATETWLPGQANDSPGGATRLQFFDSGDDQELLIFNSNDEEVDRYIIDNGKFVAAPLEFRLDGSIARLNNGSWVKVSIGD